MIGFLRLIGVINAAVWFGSAIFFTFVAGPTFFSAEFVRLIPPPYNGAAAQMLISRYFILHYCCGGVALIHLALEWLYTGRQLERLTLGLLTLVFCLTLFGGLIMQPKMKTLHRVMYRGATMEERQEAKASFRAWHGVSQATNLAVTVALLFYLWRVTSLNHPSRLPGFRKLTVGWK